MKKYFIVMALMFLFPSSSNSAPLLNSQMTPLQLPPCHCIKDQQMKNQQMANCQEPDGSDCTVDDGSGNGSNCLCKKVDVAIALTFA
ncbi:MAG TPA: hypothetical protein VMW10_05830 [Alphaproteobacteria bacterium]|nr:hypothetical protein [Alphaproteobacteria bacterium]